MKKSLILVGLMALFIAGCGDEKTLSKDDNKSLSQDIVKTLTCKVVNGEWKETVEILYSGEYVTKVVDTQKKTIKNDRDKYRLRVEAETYQEMMGSLNTIIGNGYKLTTRIIDGKTLIHTTIIDYTKVNTDKLIKSLKRYNEYVKDGKIKIADIQKYYKKEGFICK